MEMMYGKKKKRRDARRGQGRRGNLSKLTRYVSCDRAIPHNNHLLLPFLRIPIILFHLTTTNTMSRPSPPRQPSTRPPTAVTGPFFPAGDTATFKDLLLFEERLKMNASMLRRRKGRYEGESPRMRRRAERGESSPRARRGFSTECVIGRARMPSASQTIPRARREESVSKRSEEALSSEPKRKRGRGPARIPSPARENGPPPERMTINEGKRPGGWTRRTSCTGQSPHERAEPTGRLEWNERGARATGDGYAVGTGADDSRRTGWDAQRIQMEGDPTGHGMSQYDGAFPERRKARRLPRKR
jgi:hypothetical protein